MQSPLHLLKSRADTECEQFQPKNNILSPKLSTSDHFDSSLSSL